MIDADPGARQHRERTEKGQPPHRPDQQEKPDADGDPMRPALPDAQRAGRQPTDVLEGQRAEEKRGRARRRPETHALHFVHLPNSITRNPPISATRPRLNTSPNRSSMKSRMGTPYRHNKAAITKKRSPRATRLATMKTPKFNPVAPERMVMTL